MFLGQLCPKSNTCHSYADFNFSVESFFSCFGLFPCLRINFEIYSSLLEIFLQVYGFSTHQDVPCFMKSIISQASCLEKFLSVARIQYFFRCQFIASIFLSIGIIRLSVVIISPTSLEVSRDLWRSHASSSYLVGKSLGVKEVIHFFFLRRAYPSANAQILNIVVIGAKRIVCPLCFS